MKKCPFSWPRNARTNVSENDKFNWAPYTYETKMNLSCRFSGGQPKGAALNRAGEYFPPCSWSSQSTKNCTPNHNFPGHLSKCQRIIIFNMRNTHGPTLENGCSTGILSQVQGLIRRPGAKPCPRLGPNWIRPVSRESSLSTGTPTWIFLDRPGWMMSED